MAKKKKEKKKKVKMTAEQYKKWGDLSPQDIHIEDKPKEKE